ncbi:hypothetical protein KK120_18640 [Virgibacillus dakarensis]|nr:hypothetical protein [Virgibacillus dakarensis]
MAVFSLQEAAKLQSTKFHAGIYMTLAKSTPLMQYIKFMDIPGNAFNYNINSAIAGTGFRDYNGELNEKQMLINNTTETLKIMQASAGVDRAILKTRNDKGVLKASILEDKLNSLAYDYTFNFFKGDSAVERLGFDGLEKRLVGRQVLDAGGGLTLEALDEALLRVAGPNNQKVIFMGHKDYVAFRKLVRNEGTEIVGQDSFGNQIYKYGDAIIAVLDVYDKGDQETGEVETIDILDKSETFKTATDTSSIYIARFGNGENWITGLQNDSGIDVNQYAIKNIEYTDVEWINGFGVFHPRAAVRLAGIK